MRIAATSRLGKMMKNTLIVLLIWASSHEKINGFVSPRQSLLEPKKRSFPIPSSSSSFLSKQLTARTASAARKPQDTSKTALAVDIWNAGSNRDSLTFDGREPATEDFVVVLLPAVLTAMAFSFYEETSASFHKLVDFASSNTWQAVDGGAYLSDLLIPALNGPVVTFISLLFGSLSSMTLSNLYNRQVTLANKFAKFVEDIRLLDLHLSYFPAEFQLGAKTSLRRYASEVRRTFLAEISTSEMQLRQDVRGEEVEHLMSILHQVSMVDGSVSSRVLDEAYGTLNRIIDRRSDMAAVYDQQFPLWHYGNLALLAFAICTVFFILTDRSALIFLGAFQLRTCWAILVGTISVLFCVIYDLNTPLQGVFQIVKQPDRIFLRDFARETPNSFMKGKESLLPINNQ
ncbi:DUF4239 domain containing protein [Nitzschia inconspicua]|uniref:DUF4239 domain containing protein n=1 Tax=Nitzschia inconspicua TaxID=303405 RepID=A0A9K3Q0T9_9STRA|nr:DUF4239 domain containing protein [Nitzschia inconspicua]